VTTQAPSPLPSPPAVSLLWPDGAPKRDTRTRPPWPEATLADLGLGELVRALALEPRFEDATRSILLALCDDAQVIAYRQDALDDLLHNDALADALRALLPTLAQLAFLGSSGRPNDATLQLVIFRLGELELYVEGVTQLRAQLLAAGERVRSAAFQHLRAALTSLEQDPAFQALRAELPDMLARVRNIGSITVGVNLDNTLRPIEATLLAVNAHRFRGASLGFLDKLFKTSGDGGETAGIGKLHRVTLPDELANSPANLKLVPLFRDLSELLDASARPVAESLTRYARLNGRVLVALAGEIAFLLGALRLMRTLQAAHLPVAKPDILPKAARALEARDMVNVNLALRLLAREPGADLSGRIVPSDATFGEAGRIWILTGPNQGGKTTFTQAVGLLHVLAQAGLHVPASKASLSPVDAIYTHFASEEKLSQGAGRLGEEAKRLADIFGQATTYSLVLLNESLSSTSPHESLLLSEDVTRGLRLLGARAIFATHLHGLAEASESINAGTPGDSRVGSLVSLVENSETGVSTGDSARDSALERTRTFRIIAAPPQGNSHARDIAQKYGISFEQLAQTIRSHRTGARRPSNT